MGIVAVDDENVCIEEIGLAAVVVFEADERVVVGDDPYERLRVRRGTLVRIEAVGVAAPASRRPYCK